MLRIAIDVAGARAVREIACRVFLFLGHGMRISLEVLGMATRAGTGIGRRGPGHLIGVAGVAARAVERALVLARIGRTRVPEDERAATGLAPL